MSLYYIFKWVQLSAHLKVFLCIAFFLYIAVIAALVHLLQVTAQACLSCFPFVHSLGWLIQKITVIPPIQLHKNAFLYTHND